MSAQSSSGRVPDAGPGAYDSPAPAHGEGWVLFAGTMLLILGILNIIGGIAAISDSRFYVGDAKYIVFSLHGWGWAVLITGVIQFLVALGIWARQTFATWVGVFIASLNAIAQLLMLPAYPFWSLALFTLDILVVYGLLAYGGHHGQRR